MPPEYENVKKVIVKQAKRITDGSVTIGGSNKMMIGGTTALWTVQLDLYDPNFSEGHLALVTTNRAKVTGIIIVHRQYLIKTALTIALNPAE